MCGTLAHPDRELRRRKINFDLSYIHAQREDPTPQTKSLLMLDLQWLAHKAAKSAGMSIYQSRCPTCGNSVNLFHSTASKTFVCDCSSPRDMTVLLFAFVFLLHLSFFLSFLAAGAKNVFGRVLHCFPSHRWGGRLNLKAVSVTWRSHSHSLSAARSLMRTYVVVVFCTL